MRPNPRIPSLSLRMSKHRLTSAHGRIVELGSIFDPLEPVTREAVHYQPFHWVCCFEGAVGTFLSRCFVCGENDINVSHVTRQHFASCASRSLQSRTFLREDQLLQHINGTHLGTRVTKKVVQKLLSSWKTENQQLDASARHCGFCGTMSSTWAERQNHVFRHLKQPGIRKSAWWTDRPPVAAPAAHINSEQSLQIDSDMSY
jgi:hypothetical protein